MTKNRPWGIQCVYNGPRCIRIRSQRYARIGRTATPNVQTDCVRGVYWNPS